MTQRGFVVIAVTIGLTMIAIGVLVLSAQSEGLSAEHNALKDRARIEHLLNSAEAHARWTLNEQGCSGYNTVNATNELGAYTAQFNRLEGSPIDVSISGVLTSGLSGSRVVSKTASYAPATPIIIEVEKSSHMKEWDPDKVDGNHKDIHIGGTGNDRERGIIEFSVASIPEEVVIESAKIVHSVMAIGTANDTITIHRVTNAWSEADVTWDQSDQHNGLDWNTPGGDFINEPVASVQVPTNTSVPFEIDITSAVRDWHSGAAPNHGLIYQVASASGSSMTKFHTEDEGPGSMTVVVQVRCECGQICAIDSVVSCDANFRVNRKSSQLSHGIPQTIEGVTTVPGNVVLMGITFPETGGTVVVYDDILEAFDSYGNSLGTCDTQIGHTLSGVTYVINGPYRENLALTTDRSNPQMAYVAQTCSAPTLTLQSSTITSPTGITYLELPEGHLYEDHFVVTDSNGNLNFVDPSGTVVGTSAPNITATQVRGIAHVYNQDRLLLLSNGAEEVYRLGFGGVVEERYDYSRFGSNAPGGLAVDLDSCEHIVASQPSDEVSKLSRAELTVQPVSHWKLDETTGSTVLDSIGGQHGTLGSGGTWTPTDGAVQGAVRINTASQGITIPYNAALDMEGSFTVAGWINTTGATSWKPILGVELATNQHNYWLGVNNLRPRVIVYNGSDHYVTASNTITPGLWYHLVGMYDADVQEVRIYVNGTLTQTQTVSGPLQATPGVLYLGRGVTTYTQGKVDDVYLFDRAITDSDIAMLYAEAPEGTAGLYATGMSPPAPCAGFTIADDFETNMDWTGSSGTWAWSGAWTEINEADDPTLGEVRKNDVLGNRWAQVKNGDHGLRRVVDLSVASSATLTFQYARSELDDNDSVHIAVGNGTIFNEIGVINEPGSSSTASPETFTATIPGPFTADAYVQIRNKSTMNVAEGIQLDNFVIQACP